MKILQIINAFYPCQIWGGPPQNTLIISKALQARGHEVRILTTNILDYSSRMKPYSFQDNWEGLPVTYLNAYWWGRQPNSTGFIVTPDFWRYHHLIRWADIVHIQGYRYFLFLTSSLLAQCFKTPFVIQARGTLTTDFGRSRFKKVYDQSLGRFVFSKASGAIALTDDEIDRYQYLGVPKRSIKKLPNPLDISVCSVLPSGEIFRRKHEIKPNEKIVLFLSRLHERKGLALLINAVAELRDASIRLCIVGPDNGFRDTAEALVDKVGIRANTIFTGPLYEQEKFEAYRAADVYVLPSKGGEGLPTTVVEACYAGCPVILTKSIELSQLVEDEVGLAIDYDVIQLKQALKQVLNSPELQQKFRNNMKDFLNKHFKLETVSDNLEKFYTEILRNYA